MTISTQLSNTPKHTKQREHCKPHQGPWWKNYLEIIAVFVGIYAVFVYKGQWDAALTSNRINNGNIKRTQRAWVSANMSAGHIITQKNWQMLVNMKNSGQTPARKVKSRVHITDNLKNVPDFDDDRESTSSTVVFPSTDAASVSDIFSEEVVNHLQTKNLVIYGTIWYEDIYKVGHWTQYCEYFTFEITTGTACPVHNTTDDADE